MLTETRLGRPMDDALGEMAERVGSKNLSFVVTAVTIQRQVGGSLAGIFDMVAEAVRQRQPFARKIRALTAMGRMSAYVLAGIPLFLLGAITLLNREYMSPIYTTSTGHMLHVHRRADDGLRQPDPPQNRLLQRLMPDVIAPCSRSLRPRRSRLSRRRSRHPARPGAPPVDPAGGDLRPSQTVRPGTSSACTSALACSIPRVQSIARVVLRVNPRMTTRSSPGACSPPV